MTPNRFQVWDKRKRVFVNPKKIGITPLGVLVAPDETWLKHDLADLQIVQTLKNPKLIK